ncbi:hypothetical protein [Colwellia sp. Bg11-28]|uniref:hypothetical protein n=1 Tax=Colwellia sp. Bg11-28 TaxID=2058305 RepID=UPI000C32CAD8|nr:hypothetical protein [Colwellia sp. Bg11-28]PKH87905.1 hypothetical protein CXF79_14910 [Colwellia sp. Bg11-28]
MSKSWLENKSSKHILNKSVFEEYGGKAMGLKALDWLALELSSLTVPLALVVKYSPDVDEFLQNCLDVIPSYHFGVQAKFSVKTSTTIDDFSIMSARGKNSSNGKSLYLNINSLRQCHQELVYHEEDKVIAIIFQAFVSEEQFFILHYDGEGILFELVLDRNTFLYRFNENGNLEYFQSTSESSTKLGQSFISNIQSFIPTLKQAKAMLGFEFNVEGFIANNSIYLIQLRPIPLDFNYYQMGNSEYSIYSPNVIKTNFVFGQFEETIAADEFIDVDSLHIDKKVTSLAPLVFVNKTTKLPLQFDVIKQRVEKGLVTTVINTHTGFLLSHSKQHIPVLEHRNYFRCFSISPSDLQHLRQFKVVSNGYQAIILSR